MSLVSRDPVLLTPGPLTTSLRTKCAMLHDWGSWDGAFNALTAKLRSQLLEIVNGQERYSCVPLQGSGTFAVEAAVNTLVPRDGHLLILINGAYGKRMQRLASMMGRRVTAFEAAEHMPVTGLDLERELERQPDITHVAVIHCETSTGIENPLRDIALVSRKYRKHLIIDAMSSFGALELDAADLQFDALIAASGKCIEGPPGMGFVIAKTSTLEASAGRATSLSLDLYDQWRYMESTGQWRFTPPTHVVAAFHEALTQFVEEGGRVARHARYSANYRAMVKGMQELDLRPYLASEVQAPIIVTWHAPQHPNYDFKQFYARVRDKGFILYPGKLTAAETFRVGCIGAIGDEEMRLAVHAMGDALREMGIPVKQGS